LRCDDFAGLFPASRKCQVPANNFAEYAREPNGRPKEGRRLNSRSRGPAVFGALRIEFKAPLWNQVEARRRPASCLWLLDDGTQRGVEPIHPKAMPGILTTEEERDVGMRAP
jgi:putative SOS response-associated peptidase YedK